MSVCLVTPIAVIHSVRNQFTWLFGMPRLAMFVLYKNVLWLSAGQVRTNALAREFVMCEQDVMTITEYRTSLGLSQEAFAAAIGLKSKGYVSDIERRGECSPEVALAIEAHSNRLVDAATLAPIIAAAREGIAA